MSEFLAMGGYAAYVWPSYILVALVMVGLLLVSWRGLKSKEATLKSLRRDRRDSATADADDA